MRVRWLLGAVFGFFVVFLMVVWVVSERARPVLLDERGQPVKSGDRSHH